MKVKKLITLLSSVLLVLVLVIGLVVNVSCAKTAPPAKDKIIIGQAHSISGFNAPCSQFNSNPSQDLWVEEVNKEGGIYVPQYGKRLPVELLQYDDRSDWATSPKLYEKLITVDKVDLTLPPCGTWPIVASAPTVNKYKQPWIVFTSGSLEFARLWANFPYFFTINTMPDETLRVTVDSLKEIGVKTAAVLYDEGWEVGLLAAPIVVPYMQSVGIDPVMVVGYPQGTTDFSTLLKQAQASNVDALFVMGVMLPAFNIPKQAMVLNYNPKLLWIYVGSSADAFVKMYGHETIEGVMGVGGWTKDISPEAEQFYNAFMAKYNRPPYAFDVFCIGTLQVLQQAVEKVGFADLEKLRDTIANDKFVTAYGDVKFENQFNKNHPGIVAQWQKGVYQPIAPKGKYTVPPIYPKPAWPKQ